MGGELGRRMTMTFVPDIPPFIIATMTGIISVYPEVRAFGTMRGKAMTHSRAPEIEKSEHPDFGD